MLLFHTLPPIFSQPPSLRGDSRMGEGAAAGASGVRGGDRIRQQGRPVGPGDWEDAAGRWQLDSQHLSLVLTWLLVDDSWPILHNGTEFDFPPNMRYELSTCIHSRYKCVWWDTSTGNIMVMFKQTDGSSPVLLLQPELVCPLPLPFLSPL